LPKEEPSMSLVQCPECHRLCFSDFESCVGCLRKFEPGELRTKLMSENRVFERKFYAVFLILFVVLAIALGYQALRS
jgi:hypothetical protein